MKTKFIDREELTKIIKKVIAKGLTYQYKGKPLTVTKVDKIENVALPEEIEQGENDFSFNICVRRLLDNGTDVYECFKSLMASFIIDKETGVTVKEPVILIDKL